MVPYEQYGPPFTALAVGTVFTVTVVEAVDVQLFPSVTVKEYVPPLPLAANIGFCVVELKELGPLQLYEAKLPGPPVSAMVP